MKLLRTMIWAILLCAAAAGFADRLNAASALERARHVEARRPRAAGITTSRLRPTP
jgi:hypothetical protein